MKNDYRYNWDCVIHILHLLLFPSWLPSPYSCSKCSIKYLIIWSVGYRYAREFVVCLFICLYPQVRHPPPPKLPPSLWKIFPSTFLTKVFALLDESLNHIACPWLSKAGTVAMPLTTRITAVIVIIVILYHLSLSP